VDVVVHWGFSDVGTDEIVVLFRVGVLELKEMTFDSSHCLVS
jgi:hypothetical protein